MNESQIEAAAREFCRLQGLDPDERINHAPEPNEAGERFDVLLCSPRWRVVANSVRSADMMNEAIKLGKSKPDG